MKQRLLVMNGQRVVQTEHDGSWINEKVNKAGALKPGIYNIYLGQAADKSLRYDGMIVHVDKDKVYQQIGKNFIVHEGCDFERIPEIGTSKSISYDSKNRAVAVDYTAKIVRGRSR